MEIKKKYMSKKTWKRILKKQYICKEIKEKNLKGQASLIFVEKLTEPSFKEYSNNKYIKIVDNNYYWLQIGLEEQNYWITAMYNEKKELIQVYIDVTEKNVINENDSYYYDLFLDIVLIEDQIILLDEKELKEALEKKEISKEQYELAYKVAKDIIVKLQKEKENLKNICKKYLESLIKELK